MKKTISTLIFALFSIILFGQNENPYRQFGYEAPIMNEKKVSDRTDIFVIQNPDSTDKIGFIFFDVKNKQIVTFSNADKIISIDTLLPNTISRWLTTDPAHQYPSPYLGMGNNPINGIDKDGAFFDGYEGSDGSYVWHNDHHEQSFTDNAGTTWTRITADRGRWNEAMTIRNANILGLVKQGFDMNEVKRDVRLLAEGELFTKYSLINNHEKYTTNWTPAFNSDGSTINALQSPELGKSNLALKYYAEKNNVNNTLGIVKNALLPHVWEYGWEKIDGWNRDFGGSDDYFHDMHYQNAKQYINYLNVHR